jgi:hypothetical protein
MSSIGDKNRERVKSFQNNKLYLKSATHNLNIVYALKINQWHDIRCFIKKE